MTSCIANVSDGVEVISGSHAAAAISGELYACTGVGTGGRPIKYIERQRRRGEQAPMRGSLFSSNGCYSAAHPNEGYFAKYPSPGIQLQCFRQILHWFHDGALCLPFHDGVCVGANHCGTLPDPATFVLPHAWCKVVDLRAHGAGGTH